MTAEDTSVGETPKLVSTIMIQDKTPATKPPNSGHMSNEVM